MENQVKVLILCTLAWSSSNYASATGSSGYSEEQAGNYLNGDYEKTASNMSREATLASWESTNDPTNKEKTEACVTANNAFNHFISEQWETHFSKYEYDKFKDSGIKRQFLLRSRIGIAALPREVVEKYNKTIGELGHAYQIATVRPYPEQDAQVKNLAAIQEIRKTSSDYDELKYYWEQWRDITGKPMRLKYQEYVMVADAAAKISPNASENLGDFWTSLYESRTFKEDIENVWREIEPLYVELHAYVRYRLTQKYPHKFNNDDPMPESILGDVMGFNWGKIYKFVEPYTVEVAEDNVTKALKQKFGDESNETTKKDGIKAMFKEADSFFMSMGLESADMAYGEKAIIIKPLDNDKRKMSRWATTFDFGDKSDYRIKIIAEATMEDYKYAHWALANINYMRGYRDQPITFRRFCPGLNAAIGDVVRLGVASRTHLVKMGYLEDSAPCDKSTVNFLMKMALEEVAFLPSIYKVDKYRWDLFDGKIPWDKLNEHWVKMGCEYQGILPPVMRREEDFDAGNHTYVRSNVPYIGFFVAKVLQFQLLETLCEAAGHHPSKPLHECDFSGSTDAGDILKKIFAAGTSESWQNILKGATGKEEWKLCASGLIKYFKPLAKFLKATRMSVGYTVGWKKDAWRAWISGGNSGSILNRFFQRVKNLKKHIYPFH